MCRKISGEELKIEGKAFVAVWMVRVMGEKRIRSGVVPPGRVICAVVVWPSGVRGGSR